MLNRFRLRLIKKFIYFFVILFISLYFTTPAYSKLIRSKNGDKFYTKQSEVKNDDYVEFARVRGERVLCYNDKQLSTFLNTVGNKTFVQIIEEEMDICFIRIPDLELGYYEAWINKTYLRKRKKNNQIIKYYGKPLILMEDLIEQDNAWVYSDSTVIYYLPKKNSRLKNVLKFGNEVFIQKESKEYYYIKIYSEENDDYSDGWVLKKDITRDEKVLSGELLDTSEISDGELVTETADQLKKLEERRKKLLLIKQEEDRKALEDLGKSSNNTELQFYLSELISKKKDTNSLLMDITELNKENEINKSKLELFKDKTLKMSAEILMTQNKIKEIKVNKTEYISTEKNRLEKEKITKEKIANLSDELKSLFEKSKLIDEKINITNNKLSDDQNLVDELYNKIIVNNESITKIRKNIQSNSLVKNEIYELNNYLETLELDLKDKNTEILYFKNSYDNNSSKNKKNQERLLSKNKELQKLDEELTQLKIDYKTFLNNNVEIERNEIISKLNDKIKKEKDLKNQIIGLELEYKNQNKQLENLISALSNKNDDISNSENKIIQLKKNQFKYKKKQTKIIAEKEKFKKITNLLNELEVLTLQLSKNKKATDIINNELELTKKKLVFSENSKQIKLLNLDDLTIRNQKILKEKEKFISSQKLKKDNDEKQILALNSNLKLLKIKASKFLETITSINEKYIKYKNETKSLSENLIKQKNKLAGLIKDKNKLINNKLLNEQSFINNISLLENDLKKLKRNSNNITIKISKSSLDLQDYNYVLKTYSSNLNKKTAKIDEYNKKINILIEQSNKLKTEKKETDTILSKLINELENLKISKEKNSKEFEEQERSLTNLQKNFKDITISNVDKKSEIVLLEMQLKFIKKKKIKFDKSQKVIEKQLAELEEAQRNLEKTNIASKNKSKRPKFKKSKKRVRQVVEEKLISAPEKSKIVGHNRNNYNLNLLIKAKNNSLKNIVKRGRQKDSKLQGNITLKFTLLANGKTKNVRVVKTNWSNKKVGKYVNTLIEKKVRKWVFPPDNNKNKKKIKSKKVVKIYHF